MSKLQENIRQAQGEFKELNLALKDISFSKEHYEFLYEPAKKQQKYYQMIMSDFNVMQGESIFSGIFHATHKEVIEELFEKLAAEDENSSKTLELYTDYRTYMDYDIKITGEDGGFMYYSKVSQEKSGGEDPDPVLYHGGGVFYAAVPQQHRRRCDRPGDAGTRLSTTWTTSGSAACWSS